MEDGSSFKSSSQPGSKPGISNHSSTPSGRIPIPSTMANRPLPSEPPSQELKKVAAWKHQNSFGHGGESSPLKLGIKDQKQYVHWKQCGYRNIPWISKAYSKNGLSIKVLILLKWSLSMHGHGSCLHNPVCFDES